MSSAALTLLEFPQPLGLRAFGVGYARDDRVILADVSLAVAPGDFWALIGPNGSGKSSILRLLAGLWTATEGIVTLDGASLGGLCREALARRVSLVPQETRIDFAFTVEEIVATGRYPHRGRFAREAAHDRKLITEAMERCDVAHLRHRVVTTLSGGERQRTLIARSLATRADYLLLDEPTCSLDVEHAIEVLDLCSSLSRSGHAIVLATHDLSAAAGVATSVAVVKHGHLLASGPRDGILTPETIEDVFGVTAELLRSASGAPVFAFGHKSRQTRHRTADGRR